MNFGAKIISFDLYLYKSLILSEDFYESRV